MSQRSGLRLLPLAVWYFPYSVQCIVVRAEAYK